MSNELTPWQQIIKGQLRGEVMEMWRRLKELRKAEIYHSLIHIYISLDPTLKISYPNGKGNFLPSVIPFCQLVEEQINIDPLGFTAMDFDIAMLLSN